ncbi:uncharacterized protein LOC118488411 isoform X2 [Helianthus annuus]|uniref:uncharacterized protein LOC118488411 isoform X2 n=1 Tax=Helianthus annuus TaxID=4232 RepID=UPI001653087D|nr:uncharacterized protein LOC118488411 isoform X2 [Helianthus annuus]
MLFLNCSPMSSHSKNSAPIRRNKPLVEKPLPPRSLRCCQKPLPPPPDQRCRSVVSRSTIVCHHRSKPFVSLIRQSSLATLLETGLTCTGWLLMSTLIRHAYAAQGGPCLRVYDKMSLPNGVLRLQPSGGHGYHNGDVH